MKTFIKKKEGHNQAGPGFRTPDFIKGSKFGSNKYTNPKGKFKPSQFKTQHKG